MVEEYRAKGAPPRQAKVPKARRGPSRFKNVFHAAPIPGPGGMVPFMVPEEIADGLGRHLEALSLWSRDDLVAMADADGKVDVTALPPPTIRHDPPEHGPNRWDNPGQWVPVGAPPAVKRNRIDATKLTDEQARMLEEERDEIEKALRAREIMKLRYENADPHVRRDQ